MKHRLLVMNDQRIIQTEQDRTWKDLKVEKSGALKPGIYNLCLAEKADKTKNHDRVIVCTTDSIYQ